MEKLKLNLVLSIFLLLNYLDKPIPICALNSDLNYISDRGVDWDWMQTGKLGMVEGGHWLRSSLCPDGSFVTGYQMKYGQAGGNATGEITGLKLICSVLDQNYKLKTTRNLNANGASIFSSSNSITVTSNRQAIGFSMARWTDSEDFEFVDGRKLKFYGEDESGKYKTKFRFPSDASATLFESVGCPEDWAVCGMQAREKDSDNADGEPILTQLRFKCCYYCIPQEKRVVLDDYTNPGSTDYTRTIRRTVGTQFDRRGSKSGSDSRSTDLTNESQKGNSKSLSSSQMESEGNTSGSSAGKTDSKGWNTGEELRISTSNQNNQNSQISGSTSTSESNSRSVGKSKAKTDSSHWSQTKGDSSSHTVDVGGEYKTSIKATAGVTGVFSGEVETSLTLKAGYSYNTGRQEDNTKGGSGQAEERTNVDDTQTSQSGTNKQESTGASQTNANVKGASTNTGTTGGNTLRKEQSRQKSIQRAKEQSIQEGAQAMFTQRQAEQQSWQFNWEQSDSSLWREEREDTQVFTCEAMQRCKIEQVYGTCGTLRIGTTKIEKKIELLNYGLHGGAPKPEPETVSNNTKEIQWDINIPGETWIVVKGLSHWEPSGRWENVQVCPPDTIVTGHIFKHVIQTGFTGIALVCSDKYGPDEGESEHDDVSILRIQSEDEPERNKTKSRGRWGILTRGSRSIFAEGYSFVRQEVKGRRSIGSQEIVYHNIKLMKIRGQMAVNSSRVVTKCPPDHAICGLTAMMDKAGTGILTAFGFKCCHHCIPEEKWVTVHQFDNKSPSNEEKQVKTTVGLQRTQTNMESNSQNFGNTTDSAGINRRGLHAGFSARFGTSRSTGFDWSHTTNSIWNDETTVTETYTCEAFRSCVYRKLVGQCGSVRVPVDKFDKVSVPIKGHSPVPGPDLSETIDQTKSARTTTSSIPTGRQSRVYSNQYNLEDELTPVQVLKNGEIWIEAQNIQVQNLEESPNTIWGGSESCPLGSFVTGYRVKKIGGEDKNTKELLKGLELECSKWNAQGKFQQIKLVQGDQGARGPGRSAFNANPNPDEGLIQKESPAVGFHLFFYEWFDDDGQLLGQSTTGHSLIFDRWSTPELPDFGHFGSQVKVVPEKVLCPTDYVICGVRTRKDAATGVLTAVKFQCCYHCQPFEMNEELGRSQNPTGVRTLYTIPHVVVGAGVEVKNPIVEGSTFNTFTLIKGFSDYRYLQEMFSHRLPKKLSQSRVNWEIQRETLWKKEIEETVHSYCEPQHKCAVYRVVGKCGDLRIRTRTTINSSKSISDPTSVEVE